LLQIALGSFVGLGFMALGLTGALWSLAIGRFFLPNALAELPSRFLAGKAEEYPFGHVETRYAERWGVWVVHGCYGGKRQIYALRTTCTHLGCITLWQESERRFKCPCHGSAFLVNGSNVEGPASRPLERVAIHRTVDGQIEVDRTRTFRKELGQWNDPESYVTA
jgi:cytochrome b6-f complex iron-sulfur subunit